MRPDDETQDFEPPEEPPTEPPTGDDAGAGEEAGASEDAHAGEHEAPPPAEPPPPATYAGRKRAEGDPEAGEDAEQPAAPDEPADEDGEDLRAGFTEEFDEIERDLDAELAGLGEAAEEDDEPEEDAGPVAAASEDEELDEPDEPDDDEFEQAEPDEDELKKVDEPEELDDLDELDPDELADDDDLDEPELEADEDAEEEADRSGETVEAETVAMADKAEAEDAALAGLRARTAKKGGKPGVPATPAAVEAAAPPPAAVLASAAVTDEEEDEEEASDNGKTPRARRLWPRFLAASMLIVVSVAAATSISLLAYLTDIAKGLSDNDTLAGLREQLTEADGGDPQTILIIGSDKRLDTKGDPGRSDTTILLRVDPDKHAIALLSIPRDLRVNIPGVGLDKFNAAYSAGGPEKTLQVVEQLTGLEVNHVVNINFTGFADAVNAIGCVYIDVDRRYYIPPETGTSEIDVEAGYQRMCGYNALAYVRFRHFDNDLVRAARQQDFLREARQKLPPGVLIRDRNELLDIFTEYTTSDIGEAVPLLELLKTFLAVQAAPVSEVHFPAELGETYVTANDGAIKEAVAQFLNLEGTPGERPAGESPPAEEEEPEKPADENKPNDGGNDKPDEPKPESSGDDDHFEGPEMQDSTNAGPDLRQAGLGEEEEERRPDGHLPDLLPDPARPGLVHRPRLARLRRSTVPTRTSTTATRWSSTSPATPSATASPTSTTASPAPTGSTRRSSSNPSETRTIDGRTTCSSTTATVSAWSAGRPARAPTG